MAARRRGTFLIQCWFLDDGAQRLVLEHIQSGERTVCTTMAAAIEWLCDRSAVAADAADARDDDTPVGDADE